MITLTQVKVMALTFSRVMGAGKKARKTPLSPPLYYTTAHGLRTHARIPYSPPRRPRHG